MIANEGEKTVFKARGITLNYHASQLVDFEVFRAMILEQAVQVVNVHTLRKSNARGRQGRKL